MTRPRWLVCEIAKVAFAACSGVAGWMLTL